MRKILITGGAGFIASNLIKLILDNNSKVFIYSYDNYYSGSRKNHIKSTKVKYIKGDNKMKYPKWVYEIVSKHLQCSIREANDAVEMYELSHGGQAELVDILVKYGI